MSSNASKLIDEVIEERRVSKEDQLCEIIELMKEIRDNTHPSESPVVPNHVCQSYTADTPVMRVTVFCVIWAISVNFIFRDSTLVVSLTMLIVALILMMMPAQKKVKEK
jgi:hypothetical protein